MKTKAHTFKVEKPKEAMAEFESLLGKLVKVPKAEVKEKRRRLKAKKKKG